MRPHRVLGHQPRDTRLCHEARAKVLGHQRPARHPEPRDSKSLIFPVPGTTPSLSAAWLIRAPPRAAVVRESKEKSNSWDFCCPSAPTLPRTAFTGEPRGRAGTAPALPCTPGTPSLAGRKGGGSLLRLRWCGLKGQKGRKSQGAS